MSTRQLAIEVSPPGGTRTGYVRAGDFPTHSPPWRRKQGPGSPGCGPAETAAGQDLSSWPVPFQLWSCRESNPGPTAFPQDFSVRSSLCLYLDLPVTRTSRDDDPSRCWCPDTSRDRTYRWIPLVDARVRAEGGPGLTGPPRLGSEGEVALKSDLSRRKCLGAYLFTATLTVVSCLHRHASLDSTHAVETFQPPVLILCRPTTSVGQPIVPAYNDTTRPFLPVRRGWCRDAGPLGAADHLGPNGPMGPSDEGSPAVGGTTGTLADPVQRCTPVDNI